MQTENFQNKTTQWASYKALFEQDSFRSLLNLLKMENTFNATDAKRSLENYLKNVLQTFINTTGINIEEIRVQTTIDPLTNKRSIKQVNALEETQVVAAAWG